jgi:hypothetical protein
VDVEAGAIYTLLLIVSRDSARPHPPSGFQRDRVSCRAGTWRTGTLQLHRLFKLCLHVRAAPFFSSTTDAHVEHREDKSHVTADESVLSFLVQDVLVRTTATSPPRTGWSSRVSHYHTHRTTPTVFCSCSQRRY